VDGAGPLIVRRALALVCAAVAAAELIVLVLLAAGVDTRTRFGPFLIIIHDLDKPLWIGLASSLGLMVLAPRSAALRRLSVLLMACSIAAALVALARTTPPVVTKSDIAVTELYVQLAATGDLLEGPYSRFEWHHPGPVYFYMQVPFYALSGHRGSGLYVGALGITLLSLALLAYVVLRTDRGALAVAILGGWLLLALRDRFLAASPWTAHVPVFSTFTFLALAAAAASGRRWMLPPLLVVGSVLAQCHVGFVPLVGVVSLVALGGLVVTRREDAAPLSPVLHLSAWLLAALWLLPVVEQLSQRPGNLTYLWTFFVTAAGSTPSYATSFAAWSYALVGVLRPDLYLPYGGHFEFTHLAWAIPLAIAEVLAVAVVGTLAHRAGRRFEAAIAWTALAATMVSLWSITRIHGDILDHEIFWIVPIGTVNLAIIAAALVRGVGARWARTAAAGPASATLLCTVLVLAAVYDGFSDFDRLVAFEMSARRKDADIDATYQCIRDFLVTQQVQKPLFRIEQWDTAAAVFVRLHQSRQAFAVEDKSVPIFTHVFSAHGDEDAIIAIRGSAGRADAAAPVVVLQRDPVYVEAVRVKH
jgi:hypothetical protein